MSLNRNCRKDQTIEQGTAHGGRVWTEQYNAPFKDAGHYWYCQRPVFSLGVSQHMRKITTIGHHSCEIITKEKTPLSHEVMCFQILDFETSRSFSDVSKSNSRKISSFSKTMSLQREPFFHNVLYHQLLPITRYQVRFYANNYFE